jgi:hypothetical protein
MTFRTIVNGVEVDLDAPKIAAGSNITTQNSFKTISFPSNTFSSAPKVVIREQDAIADSNRFFIASNITKDSFQVAVGNIFNVENINFSPMNFTWIAVQ